jgi:hypothetical protein
MELPSAEAAVVPAAKVRDYLLSPEHPIGRAKARFFVALGFHPSDWPQLQYALLTHGRSGEAVAVPSPYGQKYEVRGILEGPNGRRAEVVTVWIVPAGEAVPRLVTAFPGTSP